MYLMRTAWGWVTLQSVWNVKKGIRTFDFQSNVVPFKSYATTPSIKSVCVHNGQLHNLQYLPQGLSTKEVVNLGGIVI